MSSADAASAGHRAPLNAAFDDVPEQYDDLERHRLLAGAVVHDLVRP